jgi:hypothetical protein
MRVRMCGVVFLSVSSDEDRCRGNIFPSIIIIYHLLPGKVVFSFRSIRFRLNWCWLAVCVLSCCRPLPEQFLLISGPEGPIINIFSLTNLMARLRLYSLYNFSADRIGITARCNSSIVLCVFVSTEMYALGTCLPSRCPGNMLIIFM